MQREAMPSSFQRAPKRGSLLPSVVVLPKIGAERNENGDLTNSIRSDFVGNNSVVGNSGSFSNKKEVTKTHSQPNAIQDRTPSDGKSVIALPPTPARTSLVEGDSIERKLKAGRSSNKYVTTRDRITSLSTPYEVRDLSDRKYSGMVKENALLGAAKDGGFGVNAENTFENPAAKEHWHFNKAKESSLIRRGSCCSSCGGALSYTNSFASTRRFSAVSIEVPNENAIRKALANRNASIISGDSLRSVGNSFTKVKKGESRKLMKRRSERQEVSKAEYNRIERQRNLLFDFVSVLYKKNLVKEEVRPYVQHALKICNNDTSKGGK